MLYPPSPFQNPPPIWIGSEPHNDYRQQYHVQLPSSHKAIKGKPRFFSQQAVKQPGSSVASKQSAVGFW